MLYSLCSSFLGIWKQVRAGHKSIYGIEYKWITLPNDSGRRPKSRGLNIASWVTLHIKKKWKMVRERAARIESKGGGHKSQNGTTKDIVTSGKWMKQVSKNKDWKWSFRPSHFFFSQENTFVLFLEQSRSGIQIFKNLPYIISGSDSYTFIGCILMSMYLFSINRIKDF